MKYNNNAEEDWFCFYPLEVSAASKHYNITTMQHYNTRTLKCYNTIIYYNATTLQYHNTTIYYNTTTLQQSPAIKYMHCYIFVGAPGKPGPKGKYIPITMDNKQFCKY